MKNKYDLANVQARAIEQIVDIITTPGEEISDGECIDSIWAILKHDLEIDVDAIRDYKNEMQEKLQQKGDSK
ncbi:hypothetical protein EB001_00335 [bacterium]|nr:hypothetical protein [bacterium]